MKFFKHFTDAHRGKSLQLLMRKHGPKMVGIYWMLVEICAEKMEKETEEEFSLEHTNFEFEVGYLRNTLQAHQFKTLEMYLQCLSDVGLMSARCSEDTVSISMPKLLECLDRDTNRARPERAKIKNKNKIKNISDENIFKPNLDAIYKIYPRKEGKAAGIKKLAAEIKTPELEAQCLRAAEKFAEKHRQLGTETKFIPHFKTWVSSWRDVLDEDYGNATNQPANVTGMSFDL